jgi:hypothetical protein
MKLYLSFGFVRDDGTSERLFSLEQPIDQAAVGNLAEFVKKQLVPWL